MGARRRLWEATASGRRPAGDERGDARAVAASALTNTRGIIAGLRRGRRGGGACESASSRRGFIRKPRRKSATRKTTTSVDGRRIVPARGEGPARRRRAGTGTSCSPTGRHFRRRLRRRGERHCDRRNASNPRTRASPRRMPVRPKSARNTRVVGRTTTGRVDGRPRRRRRRRRHRDDIATWRTGHTNPFASMLVMPRLERVRLRDRPTTRAFSTRPRRSRPSGDAL